MHYWSMIRPRSRWFQSLQQHRLVGDVVEGEEGGDDRRGPRTYFRTVFSPSLYVPSLSTVGRRLSYVSHTRKIRKTAANGNDHFLWAFTITNYNQKYRNHTHSRFARLDYITLFFGLFVPCARCTVSRGLSLSLSLIHYSLVISFGNDNRSFGWLICFLRGVCQASVSIFQRCPTQEKNASYLDGYRRLWWCLVWFCL